MPRRWINSTSPLAVGQGEQVQGQATAAGALRTTGADSHVSTVTFSLDTSAYASGDLVADTQAVSLTAFDQTGGCIIIDSITVLDEDDQGVALNFVFISDSTSLGTENAAPSITDANARKILGVVPVATGDYLDIGGSRVASVRNVGLTVVGTTRALYVAIVNGSGTPTYTATGLRAQIAYRQA